MPRRVTMVDFDEIFNYAGKKFGVGWNNANDLFFDTILTYNGTDDMYQSDLISDIMYNREGTIEELKYEDLDCDNDKASYIILEFMKENELKEMTVDNDS